MPETDTAVKTSDTVFSIANRREEIPADSDRKAGTPLALLIDIMKITGRTFVGSFWTVTLTALVATALGAPQASFAAPPLFRKVPNPANRKDTKKPTTPAPGRTGPRFPIPRIPVHIPVPGPEQIPPTDPDSKVPASTVAKAAQAHPNFDIGTACLMLEQEKRHAVKEIYARELVPAEADYRVAEAEMNEAVYRLHAQEEREANRSRLGRWLTAKDLSDWQRMAQEKITAYERAGMVYQSALKKFEAEAQPIQKEADDFREAWMSVLQSSAGEAK